MHNLQGLPFTLSTTGAPVQQQQPLKYQSIPSHQHAVLMQQQFSTPLTQQHLLLEAEHQVNKFSNNMGYDHWALVSMQSVLYF